MSGFTPGPWSTWGEPTHDDPSVKIEAANGLFIAATIGSNDEANARLIAQSPALFALAEKVAHLNENAGEIGDGMLHALTTEARQLIAQVTEAQS